MSTSEGVVIIVETFRQKGEDSKQEIRVRPLEGQRFSSSLRVAFPIRRRKSYRVGTKFKLRVKTANREGTRFLRGLEPIEVVTARQARDFIRRHK